MEVDSCWKYCIGITDFQIGIDNFNTIECSSNAGFFPNCTCLWQQHSRLKTMIIQYSKIINRPTTTVIASAGNKEKEQGKLLLSVYAEL